MHKIKKYIPQWLLSWYHLGLVALAVLWYRSPSEKMIIIGVTGTKGKSTTSNMIGRLLEDQGHKVGFATTVNFKIAEKEWLNDTKMTMLGRFQLQKMLSRMAAAGCTYAVVETSSQGIEQYRHIGINYDILVFTNLSPEHIDAHGSFDNYMRAKGKLFARLSHLPRKIINGKRIEKTIVANLDDQHAQYFLDFKADVKVGYTLNGAVSDKVVRTYATSDISMSSAGTTFNFQGVKYATSFIGRHNIYNLTAALAVACEQGRSLNQLLPKVKELRGVPGRMEFISRGQNFMVIVDYAYDPVAMAELYTTLKLLPWKRMIQVLGGSGGGRDQARQEVLGKMAGQEAQTVVITTDDPYDDDPAEIADRLVLGAKSKGKVMDADLYVIPNRREAIIKAINLAQQDDLVLITGKGAEQFIAGPAGKKIPHDDRQVARDALDNLIKK